MDSLTIILKKAIAHEVIKNSEFLKGTLPEYSEEVIPLTELRIRKLLESRLTNLLGSGSHSIEMDISDNTEGSSFHKMVSLDSLDEDNFVKVTKELANKLTKSQVAGSIKSGVAFFICGDAYKADSNDAYPFTCVIKADADQALVKEVGKNGALSFKYISDMILSDYQRLLKVGFFMMIEKVEIEEGELYPASSYESLVFDHLITESKPEKGAAYFYDQFLGCKPKQSDKYKTRDFFEKTKECINDLNLSDKEKVEQFNNLNAYIRSNKGIVSTKDFAKEWLPESEQKPYIKNMITKGISEKSIKKDDSFIKKKMKNRSWKFHNDISINAKVDNLDDFVKMEGYEDGWSKVKIKGKLKSQS